MAAAKGDSSGQGAATTFQTASGAQDSPNGLYRVLGPGRGLFWLETDGAGESYRVGYPDGHCDDGPHRWQIGVSYQLGKDQHRDFA